MFGQIILQIILILLNAIFAGAEIAVVSINDTRLDKLAASGDNRAIRLKKLTSQPAKFLSTIQVAITLSGFIGSAFAANNFSVYLMNLLSGLPIPPDVLSTASVVIITLILSYFNIVFGELIPKRIAIKNSEKLSLAMSGFITAISKVFAPLVWLLNISTNSLLKLIGIGPENDDDTVTEEEILMMTDAGAEKGTIDETENLIIKNVFAFDDMTAEQICTHRTDVDVLWAADSAEKWEEIIHETRHSVFPVCSDSIDNVIGVLDAKDYFRLTDRSKDNIMQNAVREPYFVHENMKADRLFAKMKQNDADHFAVVVDEYGGMSGIITITDLVEELVGDFNDDDDDDAIYKIMSPDDNTWHVPGTAELTDVAEELDITLPAHEYETFGGYVISLLGEIPKDGTQRQIETDDLKIKVLEVRQHRIESCNVTKIIKEDKDTTPSETDQ